MNNGLSNLLTRKEAAEYLGVKPQTLAAWHVTGKYKLPLVKVGRSVRLPPGGPGGVVFGPDRWRRRRR